MTSPRVIWDEYGFSGNLYSTEPIAATAEGRRLFLGRDDERARIVRQLSGGASVVALEGDTGVGRTSLATAAAYDASRWHRRGGPLFIPLRVRLGLRPHETRESFELRGLKAVANTLVDAAPMLRTHGRTLSAPASLDGVADASLPELVDDWLEELFPSRASGGVICVIDNLERLSDNDEAMRLLAPVRDSMLKRHGLRWIICGSAGFVRAAQSNQWMSGVFLNPIQIEPLDSVVVPQVVAARIEEMRSRADATAPVSEAAFARLFTSIGRNLRFALNLAERYAFDQDPNQLKSLSCEELDARFEAAILAEADHVYAAHASELKTADWRVFDILLREKSGSCSAAEFTAFGYTVMPPLLIRINRTETAPLMTYSGNVGDKRNRTISVTDQGRLAYYFHLNGREQRTAALSAPVAHD